MIDYSFFVLACAILTGGWILGFARGIERCRRRLYVWKDKAWRCRICNEPAHTAECQLGRLGL